MFRDSNIPTLGQLGEIEFSLQLGAKNYPEQPIRSHSEAFYNLKKCLGIQSSAVHSFNITGQEYRRRTFIICIDTETILQASFTGRNTRSGDLLNIKFDQTGEPENYAQSIYIVLHSDNVMEIGDSGVRVYD